MSILQPCMLIDRVSTTGYPWGGVWLGHDFTHRCEFAHTEPLRLAESNGQVKHRGGLAQWASHMVADRPTRHAPGATRPFGLPNESMHPNTPGRNSTASCTVGADMLTSCSPTLRFSCTQSYCALSLHPASNPANVNAGVFGGLAPE